MSLRLACVFGIFLLLSPVAGNEELQAIHDLAKKLESEGDTDGARAANERGVKAATAAGDDYYLYFFERNLSWFAEWARPRNLDQRIEHLESAMTALDRYQSRTATPPDKVLIERVLSLGYLETSYRDRLELGRGFQVHLLTMAALDQLLESRGASRYDFESGSPPPELERRWRFLIPRNLWSRARYLHRQSRIPEALETLEVVERYVESIPAEDRTLGEHDYFFKARSDRIGLIDFLGYSAEALRLGEQTLADPNIERVPRMKWAAVLNQQRNLSQYYGPQERFLKTAIEADRAFFQVSNRRGTEYRPGRLLMKMAFDLKQGAEPIERIDQIASDELDRNEALEGAYSRRSSVVLRLKNGQTEGLESEFIELLHLFQSEGNLIGLPSLYREYAMLLLAEERAVEAIPLLHRTIAMTKANGWHLHLPRLWMMLAALHDRMGNSEAADEIWREIDRWRVEHSDIPDYRRVEVMKGEIARLRFGGRKAEFDRLVAEYSRQIRDMDLPAWFVEKFKKEVAKPFEKEGQDPVLAETSPSEQANKRVVLEPLVVTSQVLPGEVSRARFTLSNPTNETVAGSLRVPGVATERRWDPENGVLESQMAAASASLTFSQPIELQPFDLVEIFLVDRKPRANWTEVELAWTGKGEVGQKANWTYAANGVMSQVSVSQASLARQNPFMAVLFFHELIRREKSAERVDFRIVCDAELHIEVADARTGAVLAVDHQSDGSFLQKGDIVTGDENADGFPDIFLEAEPERRALELRVFPKETPLQATGEDGKITVELQIRIDGKWSTRSENQLMP